MRTPLRPSLLLRMPNWLGDCVMALPALAFLTRSLPEGSVFIAAREAFRPLLSAQPGVAGFLPAPGSGLGAALSGFTSGRAAARELLGGDTFDAGLLLTNSFSTALWMRGLGAKRRIGCNTDGRRILLTNPLPCGEAEKSLHFAEYYLRLAQAALDALDAPGANAQTPATGTLPRLFVPEDARERALALLRAKGITEKPVVFAPASAYGDVKDWPAAHYAELARLLGRELSLPVAVTGGKGQQGICEAIVKGLPGAVSIAGETGLAEFAGVLAQSAGFVGGDSGGAHAAGALGVPTAVIFGITNPSRTRARGERVAPVGAGGGKDVKLSTPEARDAAKKALAAIPPERVFAALKEKIQEKAPPDAEENPCAS